MTPRDIVKMSFHFQEPPEMPFLFNASKEQEAGLIKHYGSEEWKKWIRPYTASISGIGGGECGEPEHLPNGCIRDNFGSIWQLGSGAGHLVEPAIKEPSLKGYKFPDLDAYYASHVRPRWEKDLEAAQGSFIIIGQSFGLFERAWTLRGFEQFLVDLYENPVFCRDLVEAITDWFLQSVENMLTAPIDAIMFTDDYSDQRGMIFSLDMFRTFFKPCWKRIFGRIKKAGVYSILHVCGCAAPAVPDLIECGLDCLESLQPEAMDIYKLKREYGKDIRLWGGLGAQRILPFGTPEEVRKETRRLKMELGLGGGYILAGSKGIEAAVPVPNVIAYLEEAKEPVVRPFDLRQYGLRYRSYKNIKKRAEAGQIKAEELFNQLRQLQKDAPKFKEISEQASTVIRSMPEGERTRALQQANDFLKTEIGSKPDSFATTLAAEREQIIQQFGLPVALTDFEASALQGAVDNVRKVPLPQEGISYQPVKAAEGQAFIDIRTFHEFRNGFLYLRTIFNAEKATNGSILYGSDGPVKVWINGMETDCQPDAANPAFAAKYQAPTNWKKGQNHILFALATNNGKAWGIFATAVLGGKR